MRVVSTALCALSLAACGGMHIARLDPLGVAYDERVPVVAEVSPFAPMRQVDSAFALPSLGTVTLRRHVREVRMVGFYPMNSGTREPFLRVIESPEGVEGMLAEVWSGPEPRTRRDGSPPAHCTVAGGNNWLCVEMLSLPDGVTWQKVADRLAQLGAWAIRERRDSDDPPRRIVHAGQLVVERLSRDDYDAFQFNPPRRRAGRTGRGAATLYDYFTSLVDRAGRGGT